MMDADGSIDNLERAAMHEQLAANTSDVPARKMHQAMAAEYRRRAAADGDLSHTMSSGPKDTGLLMAERL
jgi:uncharacterized membrane protein YebE (DUF533 family)